MLLLAFTSADIFSQIFKNSFRIIRKKDIRHEFSFLMDSLKTPHPLNGQNPLSLTKVFCRCSLNFFDLTNNHLIKNIYSSHFCVRVLTSSAHWNCFIIRKKFMENICLLWQKKNRFIWPIVFQYICMLSKYIVNGSSLKRYFLGKHLVVLKGELQRWYHLRKYFIIRKMSMKKIYLLWHKKNIFIS